MATPRCSDPAAPCKVLVLYWKKAKAMELNNEGYSVMALVFICVFWLAQHRSTQGQEHHSIKH